MSFPAYESYKDSGVEWLGAVPSHWEVRRLKQVANAFPSNVDKKSYDDEEQVRLCNYTDVYYNDTIGTELEFMEATASADQVEKFGLRADDVIITKDSETADDIAVAAHVPRDLPGVVCGYHLSMVRPGPGTSGAFLKRFFDSALAKASFAVRANGLTRVGLGQYAVDNVDVPYPPFCEQRTIAAFLDRETAKIDALVEAQRRLMELLKEKRQAVISHAVTKGLDPSAPMKDSGVEWLGHVPAHWEIVPIKHLADIGNGSTPARDNLAYWDGGDFPWLNSSVVNLPDVRSSDQFVTELALKQCHLPIVEPPAILVGITGQGKTRAMATLLLFTATINQHLAYVKPRGSRVNSEFLLRFFEASYERLRAESEAGSTKGAITCQDLADLKVPVPSAEEVASIASYLHSYCELSDRLAEKAQEAVGLLQERRAALISAAVTGKIDVRASAAPVQEADAA